MQESCEAISRIEIVSGSHLDMLRPPAERARAVGQPLEVGLLVLLEANGEVGENHFVERTASAASCTVALLAPADHRGHAQDGTV